MKAQMSLLSLAIASGLALAAIPAEAAGNLKSAAISRANVLLGANGASAIRAANGDVFAAREAIVDADGTEHVRFQRSYRGLPVIGGDFVMHSRNGQLRNVSQSLKSAARPNLVATFGSDEAIVEAGARFGSKFFGAPTSRLVVFARGASPVLAHEVVFKGIKADQTETEQAHGQQVEQAHAGLQEPHQDGEHACPPWRVVLDHVHAGCCTDDIVGSEVQVNHDRFSIALSTRFRSSSVQYRLPLSRLLR